MGLFKSIGKGLKKVGKVVGKGLKVVSNVLPPGLRQAAAIGGSVLDGGNMQDHLGAAVGSLIPGGGGLVGGTLKKIGGNALLNAALPQTGGFGGGAGAGGVMAPGGGLIGTEQDPNDSGSRYGVLGDAARAIFSGGKPLTLGNTLGSAGSGLKKVGSFALDNPEIPLGLLAGYQGFKANQKAGELRDRALKYVDAPDVRPDLSSVFASPGDPYARPLRKVG